MSDKIKIGDLVYHQGTSVVPQPLIGQVIKIETENYEIQLKYIGDLHDVGLELMNQVISVPKCQTKLFMNRNDGPNACDL